MDKTRQNASKGMSEPGSRLISWKEIAAYLGRDVRTVLRWHKHRGLPVHRVPGSRRGGVFAHTDELEQWLARDSGHNRHPAGLASDSSAARLFYLTMGAAAVATILIVMVVVPPMSAQSVATVTVAGSRLVAHDVGGREVWSYQLPSGIAILPAAHHYLIEDLDGDATREIVVPVRVTDPASGRASDAILCLEEDGRLRWKIELDDRLRFGAGEFGPPWRVRDLALVRLPAGPRIVIAAHHDTWWPSFIATLDMNGRRHDRFVNAGWLVSVEATPDGRHLVASGVNNARDEAAVVVLRSDAVTGHSPEPDESPFFCASCDAGAAVRYFTLARTEINLVVGRTPFDSSVTLQPDDGLLVRVSQDPANSGVEALYQFSPAFVLTRAGVSDIYWDVHRRLEREGRLDHAASLCPERHKLQVRAWSNGSWENVLAPPTAVPAVPK
jgi:hypothetical protein